MKRTTAQKIADALIALFAVLIVCDVLLTCLSPALAYFRFQSPDSMAFSHLLDIFAYDVDDGLGNLLTILLTGAWSSPEAFALTVFLVLSGICAAVILVQGIRLLVSVSEGAPFSPGNSACLQRVAVCCFIIAAGALGRTVFTFCWKGLGPALLSYTALFIPVFTMAGLLCLVMAGLFHRAAQLKAENDLTI